MPTPQLRREWTFVWRAREKPTNSDRILDADGLGAWNGRPLFAVAQTRELETANALQLPPHMLMQRAGLAIAKFAMAVTPHAKTIWIACGPGNNGGDGYEAATHLKSWGKMPVVTSIGNTDNLPLDAADAHQKASNAGVSFSEVAPSQFDLCIDALFGIGRIRPWDDRTTSFIQHMNSGVAPVLSVDLPSGLNADTGATVGLYVKANFTLSLIALKPGLFTADGRAACGEIWFNSLGIDASTDICARLNTAPTAITRAHNTHKGTFGDVCIIGGNVGMTGAALLAARAALFGGAGRVYVSVLDPKADQIDICQPELMFRDLPDIAFEAMSVVAGCGGGGAIGLHLAEILKRSAQLVLDADALNAIANDKALQKLLAARPPQTTVLTPHPLEAARLMNISATEVQANRLGVAQTLADRFACIVVLKGSGTVIAAPGVLPCINTSGNALLATAGTGDVLAGLIGARLHGGSDLFALTCEAVFHHGQIAVYWTAHTALTAQSLARAL